MKKLEKIKSLIGNHEIDEACVALKNYGVSNRILDEIILQESKYSKLKSDTRSGIISEDTAAKQRSQIIQAFLQIVDDIKKTNSEAKGDISNENSTPIADRLTWLFEKGEAQYRNAIYNYESNKRSAHLRCIDSAFYTRYPEVCEKT